MGGDLELLNRYRSYGGSVEFYRPPQAEMGVVPVLYWLSGLTCSEENFMAKAGAERYAAEHGILVVALDTSPRNLSLPGETDSYGFGAGASFYVNATEMPWSKHYRMYDYVVDELPAIIAANLLRTRGYLRSFYGGHGALVCALRNPERYFRFPRLHPLRHQACAHGGTGPSPVISERTNRSGANTIVTN